VDKVHQSICDPDHDVDRDAICHPGAAFGRHQWQDIHGHSAGLGFHLLSRLFGHLGLLNDWPAVAVATVPLLIFLAIALLGIRWVDRR